MSLDTPLLRLGGLCALVAAIGCDSPSTDDGFADDDDAATEGVDSESDASGDAGDDEEGGSTGEDSNLEPEPARLPADFPTLEGECPAQADSSWCFSGDQLGLQYCEVNSGWGPCVIEPECELGEVQITDCAFGPEPLTCMLNGAGYPAFPGCPFTPLVLSFDGAEPTFDATLETFEMSGGDNSCIGQQWPTAETPWLAIDLDGSGAIENGRELFGNASPTADGHRPDNGFDALRELDSDHDGRITPADQAWDSLLLWGDYDRDRRSSPFELQPLSRSGLTAIELDHWSTPICDGQGNCGIERSAFSFSAGDLGQRQGTVIDVYIPCD